MDGATGQETQTAEQRETLESGLRMLARMIARAHLRRHEVGRRHWRQQEPQGWLLHRCSLFPWP